MSYNDNREKFLKLLTDTGKETVTKQEIVDLCEQHDLNIPQWFTRDPQNKTNRGVYKVPGAKQTEATSNLVSIVGQDALKRIHIDRAITALEEQFIVPTPYSNYVPFGVYDDVLAIIQSKQFYPAFITGPSGNGKSMSVEQACAAEHREFVPFSMTPETDENDLLGGYVLINNQMVWRDGPVTIAARRGAILSIDEIDYGAQNLSTLQRVLEGKPFLLKKKGEIIEPKPGFNIFATANTKGRGSDDGKYMFTNILNEAFLERFPVTFEQMWPPVPVEKRIIKKELEMVGASDAEFAEHLVTWSTTIRKTFADSGVGEVISTRRLVHIARAYPIFGKNKLKAIEYCCNRFDNDTKHSFLDLYSKIDASVVQATPKP